MESQYSSAFTEQERAARRAERAANRKQKLHERRIRRLKQLLPFCLLLALLVVLLTAWANHRKEPIEQPPSPHAVLDTSDLPPVDTVPFSLTDSADTVYLGEDFSSSYVILADMESGQILVEKNSEAVISPASMTKILTLLVAAEQIEDLDDTFTIPIEITDFCYVNDCSVVGYEVGESATVRELLYGTILSSGADAALGLAYYTAGSQEAFVSLMNEKLVELGLSETAHFTNCVGIYNSEHVCTVRDMAIILKAAMENPLCREVLSTHTYKTAPTPEHPEGQVLSNWFLRRIEDKDTGAVEVIGAKTGFVAQSGSCAASYAESSSGQGYLCVTGNAYSSWRCIYDHAALYAAYCKEPSSDPETTVSQ